MMSLLAIIGAATLTVAVAVYLWFAVALAVGMLKDNPEDPWWENVAVGVLWPVVIGAMLWHLNKESKGQPT